MNTLPPVMTFKATYRGWSSFGSDPGSSVWSPGGAFRAVLGSVQIILAMVMGI